MNVVNPNYVTKWSSQAQRDALTAYLAANAGKAVVTGAEVRANVPALAALKDGEIQQVALDAALKVEA